MRAPFLPLSAICHPPLCASLRGGLNLKRFGVLCSFSVSSGLYSIGGHVPAVHLGPRWVCERNDDCRMWSLTLCYSLSSLHIPLSLCACFFGLDGRLLTSAIGAVTQLANDVPGSCAGCGSQLPNDCYLQSDWTSPSLVNLGSAFEEPLEDDWADNWRYFAQIICEGGEEG